MFIIFITVYLVDIVGKWCIIGSMKTNNTTHIPMPTKPQVKQAIDEQIVEVLTKLKGDMFHEAHACGSAEFTLTANEIEYMFNKRIAEIQGEA